MIDIDKAFTDFWFKYPTDLCQGKRGGKEGALRAFKKVIKTEKDFNDLINNTFEKAKHDRLDYKPDRWPFVSTFLNQRRDQDCIPSTIRVDNKQELPICYDNKCNNETLGVNYKWCAQHIPCQHDPELRDAWKATGLDRKSPTLREDCMRYMKQAGYGTFVKSIGVDNAD